MYILDVELHYAMASNLVTYPIRIIRLNRELCYDELQTVQKQYATLLKTPVYIRIVDEYDAPINKAPSPPKT